MSLNLRASVRAIILDEDDRVLLCRLVLPHPVVPNGAKIVWAAPGGRIEQGLYGSFGDVFASGILDAGAPAIVAIGKSVVSFKTESRCTWQKP